MTKNIFVVRGKSIKSYTIKQVVNKLNKKLFSQKLFLSKSEAKKYIKKYNS
tara:strand:+ start:423 stop:575 length:153 start_codon:yes stop_codon:yes gene_type:complete